MTEIDKALACSEWFWDLSGDALRPVPMTRSPALGHWLFMVEQVRRAYRLSRDSRGFADDYRFWREHDPELKSLAVSALRNPDN